MTAQKILIHTHTYTATYVRRVEFLSLYSRSLSPVTNQKTNKNLLQQMEINF